MHCFMHPTRTLEKLNNQRLSSAFTDVTVIVAGQHFSVHKSLLAAYSSVFCTVLQDASLSQSIPNINLDGVEPEYFSVILDFIYTSKLKATQANVDQLHATAHFLQMQEVIDICSKFKKQQKEGLQTPQPGLVEVVSKDGAATGRDASSNHQLIQVGNGINSTMNTQQEAKDDNNVKLEKQADNMMVEVFGASEVGFSQSQDSAKRDQPSKRTLTEEEVEQAKKAKRRGRKPQKRVTCEVCEKVMTRTKYEVHKRVHTGEKPYLCPYCDKQFVSIYNQRIHERIHTGERPYHCNLCDKTFSDPSTTRKHKLWHAGVKNKKCGLCGKHFASLTQVKEHMRTHTKEKPYVCTECGKAYGYRCDLKRHMREHTGNLIGPCEDCGKYFNHRGNFLSHLRTHARKTNNPQLKLQDSPSFFPDDPMASTMLMVPARPSSNRHEFDSEVTIADTGDHHDDQETEILKVHKLVQPQPESDGEIEVTINDGKFYVKHSANGQDSGILDGSQIIIKEDVSVTSRTASPRSQTRLFDQHCGTPLSADQVLMFVQHAQDLEIESPSMDEPKDNIPESTEDEIIVTNDDEKSMVIVSSSDMS